MLDFIGDYQSHKLDFQALECLRIKARHKKHNALNLCKKVVFDAFYDDIFRVFERNTQAFFFKRAE